MREEIIQEIGRFIKTEVVNDPNLTLAEDDMIIKMGLIDSLGIVRLIGHLQKHYRIEKIERSDVVLDNFKSIGRIATLVDRYLKS